MRLTDLRGVILLTGFLVFIPSVLPLQSHQAQNSAAAKIVCGTLNTELNKGRCIRISFSGEVSAGKNFDRSFGPLRFRLNGELASAGWWIEVVPAVETNSGNDEYVWPVTPPYHFGNVRYLDTSYGKRAEDAVNESPRDFNFVLDQRQFNRAAELVDLAASSQPLSEDKPEAKSDKGSQVAGPTLDTRAMGMDRFHILEAMGALESLPIGKGRLQILDSRVDRSAGQDGLGAIEWLKFRVELHVPCNFTVPDASGLSIDRSQCSSTVKKP